MVKGKRESFGRKKLEDCKCISLLRTFGCQAREFFSVSVHLPGDPYWGCSVQGGQFLAVINTGIYSAAHKEPETQCFSTTPFSHLSVFPRFEYSKT